jgi:lysyl-tRNA synthetase class 2
MMSDPAWRWSKDAHLRRRPALLARGRIVAALRHWFEAEGFTEIEAATLQISPGNETHLHAFSTLLTTTDGQSSRLYLQTSPEFAAKKLIAAGETRICAFARVFRNRERTALHHPEFTMLEWYRAGSNYRALMDDCAALLGLVAETAGCRRLAWRGREANPFAPPERLTVAEAFLRHAQIDLLATISVDGTPLRAAFAEIVAAAGIRVTPDDTWSDLFSKVMADLIEPHLGLERATILMDYPVSEAALARPRPDDARLAERFELYVCGVELANAFSELTDPVEQRRRFIADMDEKERLYGERYPLDEDLLAVLDQMPATAGIALGLDRLVMLVTGAAHIEDVLWDAVPREGTPP